MACFIVPTVIGGLIYMLRKKFPQSLHPTWMTSMALGGALGLTIEHIIHGEIVPWPPFFTAAYSPESLAVMLEEMLLVGLPMSIALLVAWLAIEFVYRQFYSDVTKRITVSC